jgi:hypothetical protein
MSTQNPQGVHEIDQLSQDLFERIEDLVGYLQESIAGPAPVGTKKVTPREQARKLMSMRPDQVAQLMAQAPPQAPIFTTALDQLGAHGLALLPYLQPGALPDVPAAEEEMI